LKIFINRTATSKEKLEKSKNFLELEEKAEKFITPVKILHPKSGYFQKLDEIQSKYSNFKNEGPNKKPSILSRIGLDVMNSNRVLTNFNKKNRLANNLKNINNVGNNENHSIINSFKRSNSLNSNLSILNETFTNEGDNFNNNISNALLEKLNKEIMNENDFENITLMNNINNKENSNFNSNTNMNNKNLYNYIINSNNNTNNNFNSYNNKSTNANLETSKYNSNNGSFEKLERQNTRLLNKNNNNFSNKIEKDLEMQINNNNTKTSENEDVKIITGNILTNHSLNIYNSNNNLSNNFEIKNTNSSNIVNNKISKNSLNKSSNNEFNNDLQNHEKIIYKKINNLNNLVNLTNTNNNYANISNSNNNNLSSDFTRNNEISPQNSTSTNKQLRFSKSKTRNDSLLAIPEQNVNSTAVLNSSLVLEMLNNMDMSKESINLSYKSIILNSANLNNTFDIENLDYLTEGKLLKNFLWEDVNFIKAVKILEFWLEVEIHLENRATIINTFRRFFLFLRAEISENDFMGSISFDFFQIQNLNKIFAKILKILVFITAVFYIIYQNFTVDSSLKAQMKKLASSLSNPLMNFFEFLIFNNKKCLEKIIEGSNVKYDFMEKYTKVLKVHRISKGTKAPEALINIIKNLDSCLLIIKQFSK